MSSSESSDLEKNSTNTNCCNEHKNETSSLNAQDAKKLPAWAIILAVLAFIIVNVFFLSFATSITSSPNN